jgi:hypothetical protein
MTIKRYRISATRRMALASEGSFETSPARNASWLPGTIKNPKRIRNHRSVFYAHAH